VKDQISAMRTRRFHLESSDPSFRIQRQGAARFLLWGAVSETPVTHLEVETPSSSFDVLLATESGPPHAVEKLKRALPRDVVMHVRDQPAGLEVSLAEAIVPAAKPPRLRVWSTDLVQRVIQLEENRVEICGPVGADAHLTICCDSRRVTIAVTRGLTAGTTAVRIAACVPHGFRALVEGSIVSVWKDADFFSMVA
jgi:hypothetical protein